MTNFLTIEISVHDVPFVDHDKVCQKDQKNVRDVTSNNSTPRVFTLFFAACPKCHKMDKKRSTATYKNICSSKKRATESFLLVCFGNCLIELSISFSANIADVFVTLKLLTPSKKRRIRTYLELAIVKSLARQFIIIYLLLHHDHSLFQAVLSKSAL